MNASLKVVFDRYVQALIKRDQVVLEDVLAEEFRFTNTAARFQTKRERIASILENPVFDSLKYRNIDFEALGDVCLVFAEFQYAGTEPGVLYFGRSTFAFARQAESWKLVAQHNSHAASEYSV
jgi:ketosteroid isomerase-like protein